MDQPPSAPDSPVAVAALLAELEERSRARPDRVLRLRGVLMAATAPGPAAAPAVPLGDGTPEAEPAEPFELLIFRGFSSSTTHPTGFDPDQPALPEEALIEAAELLQGPLNPAEAVLLAGPLPVSAFLAADAWG